MIAKSSYPKKKKAYHDTPHGKRPFLFLIKGGYKSTHATSHYYFLNSMQTGQGFN